MFGLAAPAPCAGEMFSAAHRIGSRRERERFMGFARRNILATHANLERKQFPIVKACVRGNRSGRSAICRGQRHGTERSEIACRRQPEGQRRRAQAIPPAPAGGSRERGEVLLRHPAPQLGTRDQREHQRTNPAVSAQWPKHGLPNPCQMRCHRRTPQQPTQKKTWIQNT